jgi:dihydrofolate synthase / folylpolyglutamate synthase
MGGRLDSTNIIKPELSIITNIAKDHTAFLGDTIEKIAVEKAGIIKKGIPIIIGRKQNETFSVFEDKSNETNSKLFYADDVCSIVASNTIYRNNRYWLDLTVEVNGKINNYLCDQFGPYQNENIKTALTAIEVLNTQSNYSISEDNVKNGLKNVRKNTGFEGRWQIKGNNPKTLFDTGHNIDGLSVTMSHLKNLKYRKLHFVLGMVDDKDVSTTLKILPQEAIYYFCKPDVPRGLDVDILSDAAKKATLTGKSFSSVRAAYESALKNANQDDLIFVGGSTFVVAEVI